MNKSFLGRTTLHLSRPIFKRNKDLILSFPKQLEIIQEEFSTLLDALRNFAVVINQVENMAPFILFIIKEFEGVYGDENDSCTEYLQLVNMYSGKLQGFIAIRDHISKLIRRDILQQLQA